MIVSAASRMFSAISFGVFCRLAPSTSAIIRSMKLSPGFWVISHDDPVRQHRGAAGHRRPVTTGFADHRSRFTGDGRFVHRRNAFHDVAVAGNGLAGLDDHDVALAQQRCGDFLLHTRNAGFPSDEATGQGLRLGLAQASACALPRPSATASARLAKTTVSQSQNTISHANHVGSMIARTVLQTAPISTMNITGLRHSVVGSSLRSVAGVDFNSIFGSSRPPWMRPFSGGASAAAAGHRGIDCGSGHFSGFLQRGVRAPASARK